MGSWAGAGIVIAAESFGVSSVGSTSVEEVSDGALPIAVSPLTDGADAASPAAGGSTVSSPTLRTTGVPPGMTAESSSE